MKFVAQPALGNPVLEDLALTNGHEYRYQIEAVDSHGNKSPLTESVSAIPVAGEEWGQ